MAKNRREDLVVLRFSQNDCYVEVVSVEKAGVRIDETVRRWNTVAGNWAEWSDIGTTNGVEHARGTTRSGYVIGVYNRMRMSHMNAMVRAATEAVAR